VTTVTLGRVRRLLFAVQILAVPLAAQAVLTGTVREDGTNRLLAGVEVLLEGTKRQTRTDDRGRYVLGELPSGNRVALFRLIGYRPVRVRVILAKADTVRADAMMVPDKVQLDPIVVTGRPDAPRGIGREAFAERRRLGFGKFVDSTELARSANARLSDVLARLGVLIVQFSGDHGLEMRAASTRRGGHSGSVPCWMGVIYDDLVLYRAVSTGTVSTFPPPDFRRDFEVSNIEAIEVYRSAGEVPIEFGGSTASCGVIVMWSKRGR
jgi:hypothetical protein